MNHAIQASVALYTNSNSTLFYMTTLKIREAWKHYLIYVKTFLILIPCNRNQVTFKKPWPIFTSHDHNRSSCLTWSLLTSSLKDWENSIFITRFTRDDDVTTNILQMEFGNFLEGSDSYSTAACKALQICFLLIGIWSLGLVGTQHRNLNSSGRAQSWH